MPEPFGQLTQLQNLSMDACKKLAALPDSFGQVVQLQILSMV